MSNRSFVLSVVLILAVAMFASNLGTDSSNDVSGMQPFLPVARYPTDACKFEYVGSNTGSYPNSVNSGYTFCNYVRPGSECQFGKYSYEHMFLSSTDGTCSGSIEMYDTGMPVIGCFWGIDGPLEGPPGTCRQDTLGEVGHMDNVNVWTPVSFLCCG